MKFDEAVTARSLLNEKEIQIFKARGIRRIESIKIS
jgi:hypothetical protein